MSLRKKDGTLPAEHVVRERVQQAVEILRLTFWTTVYVAGLIFVAWLVEYFINEIDFANWISKRWYIPIGIVLVTMYSCIRVVIDKHLNWKYLRDLSSPLDDAVAAHERGLYATGIVLFDGMNVGQRTITCGASGLTIWKRGIREVYFPWERFKKVTLRETPSERLFLDIQLKWNTHISPPILSVPWSMNMKPVISRYQEANGA
jgi:hypothetical protein